jgi:hypothetical protein
VRETAQRQADGASKAEPRIQPVVRAVGWDWRSQDSAWLHLVRLPVHFRGLYATAVKERPPVLRAEPSCLRAVGVSLRVCARSRFNRSCQHVPAFALGRPAPVGLYGDDELARLSCT